MDEIEKQKQVLYWRMLSAMFGYEQQAENLETMTAAITQSLDLPEMLLDSRVAIDSVLTHYPELEPEMRDIVPAADAADENDTDTLHRTILYSKLLLNAFGQNVQTRTVSAQQYSQWLKDVGHLERALGYAPGGLRGQQRGVTSGQPGQTGQGSGSGVNVDEKQLRDTFERLEQELIDRMALREILADDKLAAQVTPSMAMLEQLLRDKGNLSGNALKNARRIIREYVDQLAEVLRLQVEQTSAAKIDYSVPPKRVFRNLDLQRTIWKNLINYAPKEQRLYVDRLYYHHSARKKLPTRIIVVVDQSGSMVDAMVQCAIIASIFASLPRVDVHLVAYDTNAIDLSAWVGDPFEVLMRTNLGGGTNGLVAVDIAHPKIIDPRNTAMVWVSDFYEMHKPELFEHFKAIHESGVHFIPVGAVSSSGYFSVDDWFRERFKQLGLPVLTGSPKKLIAELKKIIAT